jgi:hypothetical protein
VVYNGGQLVKRMIQSDRKKSLKQVLIFLLLVSSFLNFVTGLIKFPELQRFFIFVYQFMSAAQVSWWHDMSGLALIGLIVVHLIIKRKELFPWFANLTESMPKLINRKIIITAVFGFLIIMVGFFFLSHRPQPVKLAGVEITNYQGEKLGSIADFRENSIKGPQYVDKNSYRLAIAGLVSEPMTYTYDDILKLPAYQKVVTLNCVEGWSVKVLWEGVLIKDLLKNITVKPEAKTVIFYAADGYSTSFPLDYILTNNIMMASKMNGVVLPAERGFPFQLVAEQKWGYKWIKWITKMELSDDTNYKGFWESRGYSNDGDLNQSQFAP